MYDIAVKSILGNRANQQDAVYYGINDERVTLIACDGMGGLEGGELASRTAVEEFTRLLYNEENILDADFLLYAMDYVDAKIASLRNVDNTRMRAGTTCVLAVIVQGRMRWLSVGDSRLYVIRDQKIIQMTRDHTIELKARIDYAEKKISYEQYVQEKKNGDALCSFLGIGGIRLYDINMEELRLRNRDIVILATDGLYKSLDIETIKKCVITSKDMTSAAELLIKTSMDAQRNHNQDNTSVILCRMEE